MRDIAGLNKAYSPEKTAGKFGKKSDKKYEFDFTECYRWDPQDYTIRILPPHPEKAPKGWVKKDTHLIQRTPEITTPVTCSKVFGAVCPFCVFLDTIKAQADPDVKKRPFPDLEQFVWDRLDDELQGALADLELKEKYMLAITVFADEREEKYIGNDGKEKTKKLLSPGTKEIGKILTVEVARAKTLHKALTAIVSADQAVAMSDEEGSYLILTKGEKSYDIKHHPDLRSTPLQRQDLLQKYPNLMKLQGKQMTEEAGEAMMASSWWWKHLVPEYLVY